METTQVHCPYCAQVVTVQASNIGVLLQCPTCPGQFRVPSNFAQPHREVASGPAYQGGSRPYSTQSSGAYPPAPSPIAPSYNSYQSPRQSQDSNQMLVMMLVGIGVGIVCVVVAMIAVFAVMDTSWIAPLANQENPAAGPGSPVAGQGNVGAVQQPQAAKSDDSAHVQSTQSLPGIGEFQQENENPTFLWSPRSGVVEDRPKSPRDADFSSGRQPSSSRASGGNGVRPAAPPKDQSFRKGPDSNSFGETTKSVGDDD